MGTTSTGRQASLQDDAFSRAWHGVGERGRGGPKDVEEDVVAVPVVLGDTQDIEMTGVEGVDVGEGDDEEDDEEGEVDGEDEDFAGEGDGDEAKFQKTSFAYDDMVY
jgi:hypothetical protein